MPLAIHYACQPKTGAPRNLTAAAIRAVATQVRAQIARDYAPICARAIDNCFDKDPIFPLAAALAAKIVAEPYEVLTLYYNHYENQAKFHNTYKQIPQASAPSSPAPRRRPAPPPRRALTRQTPPRP